MGQDNKDRPPGTRELFSFFQERQPSIEISTPSVKSFIVWSYMYGYTRYNYNVNPFGSLISIKGKEAGTLFT